MEFTDFDKITKNAIKLMFFNGFCFSIPHIKCKKKMCKSEVLKFCLNVDPSNEIRNGKHNKRRIKILTQCFKKQTSQKKFPTNCDLGI